MLSDGKRWEALGLEQWGMGLLDDAAHSFGCALQTLPGSARALHGLAYLHHVMPQPQPQQAMGFVQRAIAAAPQALPTHLLHAELLMDQGNYFGALDAVQLALDLDPTSLVAQVAKHKVYALQGEYSKIAADVADRSLPGTSQLQCHIHTANTFIELLRMDKGVAKKLIHHALKHLQLAIGLRPDCVEALTTQGHFLKSLNRSDQATASLKRAIALAPASAEDFFWRGLAFRWSSDFGAALESFERAIVLDPQLANAHKERADMLYEQADREAALASYQQAITLAPDLIEAHLSLGRILSDLNKFEEALLTTRRAVVLRPDVAGVYFAMGLIYDRQKKFNHALGWYQQAMKILPSYPGLQVTLGGALLNVGKVAASLEMFQRAMREDPSDMAAQSNVVHCSSYDPTCAPQLYLARAQQYGVVVSRMAKPYTHWHRRSSPEGCLRVGLVSADFHRHPVGFFLDGFLGHVDADRLEFHAFSNGAGNDALTAQLKARCASWTSIAGMADAPAAALIHDAGLDLLIDLSGHTGGTRLPMFAWRPTPVQATWLGYWASTGVAEIDYILADEHGVPKDQRQFCSEKVWYLPDTRMCFTPPTTLYDLVPAPAPALRNGYCTFGNYQPLRKLNDAVLAAWGQVLAQLPQSRLRLQAHGLTDAHNKAALLQRLQAVGIEAHRVNVIEGMPPRKYMESHAEVDIILDSFPFPGGTTTCNALWMGVPTVTLAGNSMLARQGVSMVKSADLPDWVAYTEQEYVNIAVVMAKNIPALAHLRASLRQQVFASPLLDAPRFAENLAIGLHAMVKDKRQKADWAKSERKVVKHGKK
jgi:protein O-GlcNAc transferase